jgi:hypothetical protein
MIFFGTHPTFTQVPSRNSMIPKGMFKNGTGCKCVCVLCSVCVRERDSWCSSNVPPNPAAVRRPSLSRSGPMSTKQTFAPYPAARRAQADPPEPPPITIRSNDSVAIIRDVLMIGVRSTCNLVLASGAEAPGTWARPPGCATAV